MAYEYKFFQKLRTLETSEINIKVKNNFNV